MRTASVLAYERVAARAGATSRTLSWLSSWLSYRGNLATAPRKPGGRLGFLLLWKFRGAEPHFPELPTVGRHK